MKTGYVEVVTQPACTLFPPGCTVRGHVFHYSEILQEHVVGGFSQVPLKPICHDDLHCATLSHVPGLCSAANKNRLMFALLQQLQIALILPVAVCMILLTPSAHITSMISWHAHLLHV